MTQVAGFVVAVTFRTKPGAEAAFLSLVTRNAALSLADEPGCRRFDVCTGENPGEVFLYEIYDDREAFEKHKTMPHYHDFTAASAPLVEEKSVRIFQLLGQAN